MSNFRHGHARAGAPTQEYRAWAEMIKRCCNPKAGNYYKYGGRGITICNRWRRSFAAFLADIGPAPGPGYTPDRIDNNGHYEPGNVRWATRKEQCRNTRQNRVLTFAGRSQTLGAWAEELGINHQTISQRLNACGWSVEKALSTPVLQRARR
jgi:hypothetical protein